MYRLREVDVLGLAMAVVLALVPVLGPLAVQDEPLDLGGGIAMTPDGKFLVSGSRPAGPMRIPDEAEYNGQAPAVVSTSEAPVVVRVPATTIGTVARVSKHAPAPYDLLGS